MIENIHGSKNNLYNNNNFSKNLCGEKISENIKLESNLDCPYSDGLIVASHFVEIDLNGYNITGPEPETDEKTSSKVGIMIPNFMNTRIKGPGIIQGFQAGIMDNGLSTKIDSILLQKNSIGLFLSSSREFFLNLNNIVNNQIGIALHSSKNGTISENVLNKNLLGSITSVNSQGLHIIYNNIDESYSGIYLDYLSRDNIINLNQIILNILDIHEVNDIFTGTQNTIINNVCYTSSPAIYCLVKNTNSNDNSIIDYICNKLKPFLNCSIFSNFSYQSIIDNLNNLTEHITFIAGIIILIIISSILWSNIWNRKKYKIIDALTDQRFISKENISKETQLKPKENKKEQNIEKEWKKFKIGLNKDKIKKITVYFFAILTVLLGIFWITSTMTISVIVVGSIGLIIVIGGFVFMYLGYRLGEKKKQ